MSKQIIVGVCEKKSALATGVFTGAAGTGLAAGIEASLHGGHLVAGSAFQGASVGAAGAAAGGVALLLSGVDLYRWGKGDICGKECGLNIAGNALSGGAAFGGVVLGGAAGAAIGTAGWGIPIAIVLAALFAMGVSCGWRAGVDASGVLDEEKEEESR